MRSAERAACIEMSTLLAMRKKRVEKLSAISLNKDTPGETGNLPNNGALYRLIATRHRLIAAFTASLLTSALIVAVVNPTWLSNDNGDTISMLSKTDIDKITDSSYAESAKSAAAAPGLPGIPVKNETKTTANPIQPVTKKPSKERNQVTETTKVPLEPASPSPTSTPEKDNTIEGSNIPNGAVVGKEIPEGRYWATNCWSWSVSNANGTIASSSYRFAQSVVDLRSGEFFLTSSKCIWKPGTPPATKTLPTGKVIVGEQLTAGRWRAINQDGCVTGPTSTRDRAAITDQSKMIVWWPNTQDLIVTGEENWNAYLVGLECGGLIKVG